MVFAHLDYLLTIALFMGMPIGLLAYAYRDYLREICQYKKVVMIAGMVGFFMALPDYAGLSWGAWHYNAAHTIGLWHGAEPETYLLSVIIFASAATATIVSASIEDAKNLKPKQIRKPLWLKLRWSFAGFGSAKH